MKKRDLLVVLIGLAIIAVLWLAPEEKTTKVPTDDTHRKIYEVRKESGKKAAGKLCIECHNEDGVPFPENHPPKFRCLFCHKLQ